mgnify:CR=1 FL=1
MKRILFVIISLMSFFSPINILADDPVELGVPSKFWTFPKIYTMDEEVTWYFDMTDTGFDEGIDLYMWTWSPTEPDAGNWESSSDFAKLEYVGNNIYKTTIIPLEYYRRANPNLTIEDIEGSAGFWMRLKTKNGAYQSGVFSMSWSVSELKDFKESGEAVTSYPAKFTMDDPLSILFNIEELTFNGKKGGLLDVNFESLHFHSGLDNWSILQEAQMWLPEIVEKTKLKHISDNIYKMDLIPSEYYGVESDYQAENIAYLITTHNPDWTGTTPDALLKAADVAPYPDPSFSYFPQKICAWDILTLTRQWNEKTSGILKYTITAGNKTITGEMDGNRDKQQAHINLLKELAGQTDLTKISLKIANKDGSTLLTTDIPLIPLFEVE